MLDPEELAKTIKQHRKSAGLTQLQLAELAGVKKPPYLGREWSQEYSAEEQRKEAFLRATEKSIPGAQPKLSAVLSLRDQKFEIVDRGGRYILKPQHPYFHQMAENENLTMRMAGLIDSDVPVHGMIWSKDRSLTYFIKRFDRSGQKDKVPVEDSVISLL